MSDRELRELVASLAVAQKDTDRLLKESALETDRLLKESSLETDRRLKESALETDRLLKESARETERFLKESGRETDRRMQETDRRMQETDRRMQETDAKIKELAHLFSNQWGKLIEALVRPGSLLEFKRRGLAVREVMEGRIRGTGPDGRHVEFDVVLVDSDTTVAVEVKTTCKPEDIDAFEDRLARFRGALPRLSSEKLFGAVAAIDFAGGADRYAYQRGLFVLRPAGEIVTIANDEAFRPKSF